MIFKVNGIAHILSAHRKQQLLFDDAFVSVKIFINMTQSHGGMDQLLSSYIKDICQLENFRVRHYVSTINKLNFKKQFLSEISDWNSLPVTNI